MLNKIHTIIRLMGKIQKFSGRQKGLAGIGMLLSILLYFPMSSCKKADKYAEEVNQYPYIVTQQYGLTNYGLGSYNYQYSYLVGDTAVFLGKFFMDQPGFQIRVGNDIANIVFHIQLNAGPDSLNQYTGKAEKLDYVKFVITKSMGTGNAIPVTITSNGRSLQAPSLTIQQFRGNLGKTDTTLFVDQIGTWMPSDFSIYSNNSIPLVAGISNSLSGVICFNNLTDVFLFKGGSAGRLMGAGDVFQDKGASYTINKVLGSVLALAGDSLTFSAEVTDNAPDAVGSYVFRLCRMDLATRTVRTINRSLLPLGVATANVPPGHAQGPAASLSLIAIDLKTDLHGATYFINYFAPPTTDWDETAYYNAGIGFMQPIFDPHPFGNICRVDATDKVNSLVTQNSPYFPCLYTLPGYPSAQASDYLVSTDGSTGFVCDKLNAAGNPSFAILDLVQDLPLVSTGNNSIYLFHSYDTAAVTRHSTGAREIDWDFLNYQYYLSDFLFLPDNELLFSTFNSVASVNALSKTFYCYAGTEAGLSGGFPSNVQNKMTGPAKYVNFASGSLSFIGVDEQGSIYYYTGANDYANGLTFYKLYSKK